MRGEIASGQFDRVVERDGHDRVIGSHAAESIQVCPSGLVLSLNRLDATRERRFSCNKGAIMAQARIVARAPTTKSFFRLAATS
jgi:hypothetical protein